MAADGAVTCAHWVADHLDVEVCTAREWLRIGRALRTLPVIAAAWADRSLSYSKVRALTRVATVANEAELVELARRVPAGRLGVALATWTTRTTSTAELARRQHAARSVRHRVDPDGMTTFTVRLPPLAAGTPLAAVDTTLLRSAERAAADARVTGAWPSVAQQRADALIAAITGAAAGAVFEVVVHVRGDGCTLDDGTPIDDHSVATLLDRAFVRVLVHDADGRPLNASGRRRPTARQRRVARERHRGRCVDCGATDLVELDHHPDYEVSRHTHVDELEPRCPPCHHRRHGGG